MPDLFRDYPGRLFLVATLLPLVPAALMLLAGTVRNLARRRRGSVYWFFGGDHPLKAGGYAALAAMVVAAGLAVTGLSLFLRDAHDLGADSPRLAEKWSEAIDWVRIGAARTDQPAAALRLGYRIDHLTALLFAMVTAVGSLIFLFSLGYMRDETREWVEDREAHVHNGHAPGGHGHAPDARGRPSAGVLSRRGRFGRFFLYLSLFAFSMFNLLIADNLFQVFVSWELVGACSFFLIGFYYERPSASRAANKAFIVNRVGDAGFLVGIAIAWAAFGTLNIHDLTAATAGKLAGPMMTLMGLGVFLGCVGKSAQFPLHTWLPDAMEGPTPVSALIHAATMVAAGVYLVGRCFPLFNADVLLVIAYTGAVTLFIAATIATVQADIKRVLAYSTVSQLGFMMLALGVGGWTAGEFHLLTHAFFKALLFLGAGSVIYGLHHEQDLRRMGGLRHKMPVTAYTMLVGVLAISGAPLFSGWYSKDMILSAALGYSIARPEHALLFALPLVTAGLTAYYMVRLWYLAFAGPPRDPMVFDHAHESPWVMTAPLVVLAAFSVGVGWGWPPWLPEASYVAGLVHHAEPAMRVAVLAEAHHHAEHAHWIAGALALGAAVLGAWVAVGRFSKPTTAAELAPPARGLGGFLARKWYFDELYDAAVRRPTVRTAFAAAAADKRKQDVPGIDVGTLDGLLNAAGHLTAWAGDAVRRVQTGRVRGYVLALALTVVALLAMLVGLTR